MPGQSLDYYYIDDENSTSATITPANVDAWNQIQLLIFKVLYYWECSNGVHPGVQYILWNIRLWEWHSCYYTLNATYHSGTKFKYTRYSHTIASACITAAQWNFTNQIAQDWCQWLCWYVTEVLSKFAVILLAVHTLINRIAWSSYCHSLKMYRL